MYKEMIQIRRLNEETLMIKFKDIQVKPVGGVLDVEVGLKNNTHAKYLSVDNAKKLVDSSLQSNCEEKCCECKCTQKDAKGILVNKGEV